MKQGPVFNRIMMLTVFLAIVLYLGVYAWRGITDPYATVTAYYVEVSDTIAATGFLARQEEVILGGGGQMDLLFDEGEKVAKGQSVAVIYASTAAAGRREELRALEAERDQLDYVLNSQDDSHSSARLSGEIISAMAGLHSCVASEDFTRLEEKTMQLKSLVYQRAGAYGGYSDRAALQAQIQGLDTQISALRSASAQDTTRITAAKSGIFSGLVDGYETLLDPEGLERLTPKDLDQLERADPIPQAGAAGKLITSNTWYFICPLTEREAAKLEQGDRVSVRFSRDWSGEVEMTVHYIGAVQTGRVTVILSSTRFLSNITLLRQQSVELLFGSTSGIRVPTNAVRVRSETVTDEKTGQETQVNIAGVYVQVGAESEFKPVEILAQEEDFCIVASVDAQSDNDNVAKKALRPGDQIIVAGKDLFDGKVIQ